MPVPPEIRAEEAGDGRRNGRSLARAVLGGAGLISAAGGLNKLFSLVSAPILTKVLGPSPYGVVAILGTITSFATTVSLLGVDLSYARFFFSGVPQDGERIERFCWRFSIGMACGVSLCAGVAWWIWSDRLGFPGNLAIMVGAGVFLAVLNVMATTRQRLRGAYLRIAGSISGAGLFGAAFSIVLALFWRSDAWALLVGTAGGVALGILIAGLPPPGMVTGRSGLTWSGRREILRLGLAGAVTAPMYWMMNSADRWLLGMWLGAGPLGVYSFASGVGMIGILVNSGITLAWYPEVSRAYEADAEEARLQIGRLLGRFAGGLLVVWLAVAAAGGDVIRLVADRRFHEGARFVSWIAGGILFYGFFNLGNTGLLLKKDLRPMAAWWVLGAGVNLGMNLLLLRWMGPMGAAISYCAGFALIAAGVTWSSQSRFPVPIPWARLGAACAVAFGSGALMSHPWSDGPLPSLLLKFPVGLAVAALLLQIVAPDWMTRLWRAETVRDWYNGWRDRS